MSDHRQVICDIISEMLDTPDQFGIYATTNCYDALEKYIYETIDELKAKLEAAEQFNRDMVAKAASRGVLDGYHEMGQKIAALETKLKAADAFIAAFEQASDDNYFVSHTPVYLTLAYVTYKKERGWYKKERG